MSTQLLVDFPELASLSREDLEDLLADPAYFHAIFHSLPSVKAMFQAESELGMANEAIAKRNLELQEQVYKLRHDTQEEFNEAKALQQRQKELDREQKELYQRYSPAFLLLRLRHSVTAQDDLSETLSSTFQRSASSPSPSNDPPLSTDREVDEFVKQFRDLRKTYHKRAMWAEAWGNEKVQWRED